MRRRTEVSKTNLSEVLISIGVKGLYDGIEGIDDIDATVDQLAELHLIFE